MSSLVRCARATHDLCWACRLIGTRAEAIAPTSRDVLREFGTQLP
jgi:hypothetical protein